MRRPKSLSRRGLSRVSVSVRSKPSRSLVERQQLVAEDDLVPLARRIDQADRRLGAACRAVADHAGISGTTPEPPPISAIGPLLAGRPDEMATERTFQLDLVADRPRLRGRRARPRRRPAARSPARSRRRPPAPRRSNSCAARYSRPAPSADVDMLAGDDRRRAGSAAKRKLLTRGVSAAIAVIVAGCQRAGRCAATSPACGQSSV